MTTITFYNATVTSKALTLTVDTDSRAVAEAEVLRLFPTAVIHTPLPTKKATPAPRLVTRSSTLPRNIHIGCAWGIGSK